MLSLCKNTDLGGLLLQALQVQFYSVNSALRFSSYFSDFYINSPALIMLLLMMTSNAKRQHLSKINLLSSAR